MEKSSGRRWFLKSVAAVGVAVPAGALRADPQSHHGHAEHVAQPYQLFTGDSEWFLENISCQYACPAYTDVARYIARVLRDAVISNARL